jgi:hypothetical protein
LDFIRLFKKKDYKKYPKCSRGSETLVAVQQILRNKLPGANLTLVRFFSGVETHVYVETASLSETLLAETALVRFFFGVNANVLHQGHIVDESLAASVTNGIPFVGVSDHVLPKPTLTGQNFPADVANVSIGRSVVCLHVILERRVPVHHLATHLARVHFPDVIGIVSLHVLVKVHLVSVYFLADLANKALALVLGSAMLIESVLELIPHIAKVTSVAVVFGVAPDHVRLETRLRASGVSAQRTREVAQFFVDRLQMNFQIIFRMERLWTQSALSGVVSFSVAPVFLFRGEGLGTCRTADPVAQLRIVNLQRI